MAERNWKQADLARFLDVTPASLSRWIRGTRQIGRAELPEISRKTGIPARDLRPDLAELMGAA